MAKPKPSGMREQKARKAYHCEDCGGTIFRKETYWNFHSEKVKGNWQGRRHIDCHAAWWQGEAIAMLSALAKAPHADPSDMPVESLYIPHVLDLGLGGDIYLYIPAGYRNRFAHSPKQVIAKEAVVELEAFLQLCLDAAIAATGDAKKCRQLSNFAQQMGLVAGVRTPAEGRSDI